MSVRAIEFQELVDAATDDVPVSLDKGWLDIRIPNLTLGEFYVIPIYMWAKDDRPVEVQVFAADGQTVAARYNFTVNRQLTSNGADDWLNKRYKLDEDRHKGEARILLGHGDDTDNPLLVVAAPLTSKKIRRKQLTDAGRCPECSVEGYWVRLAMVCAEHGVFG